MKKLLTLCIALACVGFAWAQPPAGDANIGETYGEFKMSKQKEAFLDITNLKQDDKLEGSFTGKVVEVCSKKGCWMKLELENGEMATIKMKDYGFFVPKAMEGKEIHIQGEAELKVASVAELRHLAEDANKSQEEIDAITEEEKTISILANGIRVMK